MFGQRWTAVVLASVAILAAVGCGSGDATAEPDPGDERQGEPTSATPDHPQAGSEPGEPDLRNELLEMLEEDQAERTGDADVWNDRARAERLAEIVGEYGWPTFSMVGEDGSTGAWAIAQHADHDVEFQADRLELMTAAAADGEADPSQLAYLVDRVATNRQQPQVYGSQMGCVDGAASPGPIEDEANVDDRRAEVGLGPLADYLAEFDDICAADG